MQLINLLTLFVAASSALSIPSNENTNLAVRAPDPDPRGGGGGRGGGSSGGSSSGGGRSSSGSSSSGRGSSGSRGTSPNSNIGGTSSRGSGVSPAFGGRYAGGARTPYAAGARSPAGIVPGLLVGGALGFWFIAASSAYTWGPYGAYRYQYPADITYYNQTSMMNETVAGQCLCRRFQGCSCDAETPDPNNQYVSALIGDGSYAHEQANAGTYQVTNGNGYVFLG